LSSRMFVITKIKFLMKKILLIHYTFHCVSARILLYQKVKRLSSPYSLHILLCISSYFLTSCLAARDGSLHVCHSWRTSCILSVILEKQ
jgi:hypothetical protein